MICHFYRKIDISTKHWLKLKFCWLEIVEKPSFQIWDTLKHANFKKFCVYFEAGNSNVVEITKESLTAEKILPLETTCFNDRLKSRQASAFPRSTNALPADDPPEDFIGVPSKLNPHCPNKWMSNKVGRMVFT